MALTFRRGRHGADGSVEDIGTSPHAKEYSSFGSTIDLVTGDDKSLDKCCRGFIVSDVGASTKLLAFVDASGIASTWDMTNMQGAYIPLSLRSITGTTTTIARIQIYY
jgi:hypothetical protein